MEPPPETREKVKLVSKRDLDFSYFCGSGAGGQARNKVHSGCQIMHRESGAIGRASDSRSLEKNKHSAFKRLVESPKMKFWMAKKIYEVRQGETLEKMVEDSMKNDNLKFEIKNATGQWEEAKAEYFDGETAKELSSQ